ncbi:GTPase HflX [Clostridium pasteurianum DSM 525 = ATCC 6013]|uniref:GTPase HflX n=1 Tax=Clostridium pasteurianum DSM 525 = ATCC 6013 TaxID=1262449 RepID=A0A0H3J9J7_CLOPA|nr:GTPase HflX [Clostridium pasteurianum]AJA47800.1 GTPase HflX [Clostridium pasteurianum DSM 525 = ATCC 6013]AJA51788.1 GTPase HflX [Clostridium pasteurianum DSM 525 = ATCC 6013]AOZ75093.1 GTP-binding protein [Clostridium pasteurianum DSM 525 = ATCC 6013]AOZ78888.1 GTP-binding protein [Clostridium pasteurianum]ELP59701.1 GTP-binding protein [Clostridium pasteurianum DSM 525 = ATCC 6013]
MILGNIDGIRKSLLEKLEEIYEMKIPKYNIITEELSYTICYVTGMINREVSVVIDRRGNVVSVAIGDSSTVELPLIDVKEGKLAGVRIVHTHPGGNSRLSMIDVSALIKLKLDCITAVGVKEGNMTDITAGFCSVQGDLLKPEIIGPMSIKKAMELNFIDKIKYIQDTIKIENIKEDNSERAIIVGIESKESLEELEELAKACNVQCLHSVLQKKDKIDTAFYVGSGKVEEINLIRQSLSANLIIFDDELTGSQVRNLEEILGIKVIDRTTLILEIFATRARTKEAKIQVELAQLKYRSTRLMGLGSVMSRTGGGIGTRGPGEKKLEIDRRRIRERVYDLTKELEKVRRNRETQREKRSNQNIPKISLVGYTNAGKSTLRNKLCSMAAPNDSVKKENVFEADMLFATLDVTTRAIVLPDNRTATLTDTVGFVRKLPHDLVEAFKSTLEEVIYSDLLLHVIDTSNENALVQIEAVEKVLEELGAGDKPVILVLNKIDKASKEEINCIKDKYSSLYIIEISAKDNVNLDALLESICNNLPNNLKKVEYIIPYSNQSEVAYLHRNSKIDEEKFLEEGTKIVAEVDDITYNKYLKYKV